jgi:phosphate transport system substrate-binding protein
MMRRLFVGSLLLVAVLSLSACRSSSGASDQVIVTGSTTILPIAEVSGEMYHELHPNIRVLVSGVGSSSGIESVSSGSSDIGTSSRDLKPEEEGLGLVDTPIAYDAIAVVVNPANPVTSLSRQQVKAIFQGHITDWSEVGGSAGPILLVNRDEASGTREAFSKIVMGGDAFDPAAAVLPGTGQVRFVVADSPGAVGYISFGFVNASVKAVAIDGVKPSKDTVFGGQYKIQRTLHFFTKGPPKEPAKSYIDFVLSSAVQDSVVEDAGFLPVSPRSP